MICRTMLERRRGAAAIETALVIGLLLTFIICTLDLALVIFRQHALSDAACQSARTASVHGSLASQLGVWGPATYGPAPLSTAAPIPAAIRLYLPELDPSEVTVLVEWPDGNNNQGQHVRVTLQLTYSPVATWLFNSAPLLIIGSSTMPIAH